MPVGNVAYLIFGEDLRSQIIRRQVIDIIVELRQKIQVQKFFLIVFLPWDKYIRSRRMIVADLLHLRQNQIMCHVIPTPISFPLYSFKEKKWRMAGVSHAFLYVPLVLLFTFPVALFYLLFLRVRLFHCRSYPVSLCVLFMKMLTSRAAFIFDPRSDYPEELALRNKWFAKNINVMIWKYLEKRICVAADTTIVIGKSFNQHFKGIYSKMVTVNIYNNVNTREFVRDQTFRAQIRAALQADDKVIFCYSGSMYRDYWNSPELYAQFICNYVSRTNTQPLFLFLVPSDCRKSLINTLVKYGIDASLYHIESPAFSEIHRFLSACDVGMYFLPYFSPRVGIKFVEYCSIGLPAIVNENVGGAAELVKSHQLGISLSNNLLSDSNRKTAENEFIMIQKLIAGKEQYGSRCRSFAEKYCDTVAVSERYCSVYYELHEKQAKLR